MLTKVSNATEDSSTLKGERQNDEEMTSIIYIIKTEGACTHASL
jgi:hypothetical protein